jgi:hypothetical protein
VGCAGGKLGSESRAGGTDTRPESTKIVIAEELLGLRLELRSLGADESRRADTGSCTVFQSADSMDLRPASGSRWVDTLRRSNESCANSCGSASSCAWIWCSGGTSASGRETRPGDGGAGVCETGEYDCGARPNWRATGAGESTFGERRALDTGADAALVFRALEYGIGSEYGT